MLTDKQMDAALRVFQRRMQGVTDEYLRVMGEHIRDIGQLAPSDVHRLQQIRRMNRSLTAIKRRLAQAAGANVKDIEAVLQEAAKVDDRVARKITGISDASVRLANNVPLQRALRAQIAETAGTLANLSRTMVAQEAYRKAVDAAVTAVQSGAEDYESAIRRHLRQAGAMGLRVRDTGTRAVEYASGHTRRVDTAVRMNVLDAMRRMNQRAMEEVGRQFGADGVEIDAHMLCAEDHLPYQGGQYSNEEFGQIQDSLDRPFGEWNCRHTWAPIIMGVSPPAYPPEELERFRRYSTEEVTIDGRTHTRYEWSQIMRRMETAIREKKDSATLAAAAGDATLQRECQGAVNAMVKEYERLSDRTGLGPDFRRTYVAGFKDVKAEEDLKQTDVRAIMNVATGGHRNEKPLTREQIKDAVDFAVFLGMPRDSIIYSDYGETCYMSFRGKVDILRIGTDVLPNPDGKTANELITCHGAVAHEVIGHRATCLRGTNGEERSAYDEVQASVRAAKFTDGLTDLERELLMNDAKDRVASIGEDFDEYIKHMDVWRA